MNPFVKTKLGLIQPRKLLISSLAGITVGLVMLTSWYIGYISVPESYTAMTLSNVNDHNAKITYYKHKPNIKNKKVYVSNKPFNKVRLKRMNGVLTIEYK